MKKLFVIAVALAAVFGFSAGAFAGEVCTNCPKCPLGNISCDIPGAQADDDCKAFDYDYRKGYCSSTENAATCKAIFNICDCADQSAFVSGELIAVRMTILVDGKSGERGAYWSSGASANVKFGMYKTETEICDSDVQDRNFGTGKFFKSNLTTEVTTLIADKTCVVPAANQATVILTDDTTGYLMTAPDVAAKLSHWWIDIAQIRIDPNVLHNGEKISVEIELLNERLGGICADCAPVCECTIDVAIVCCEDIPLCMYFPYVVTQDSDWGTGIVVTNLDPAMAIEDMEATFTLTDSAGSVFTYVKTDFDTKVWPFWLDDELANFSGTPVPGPAWLKVETNFYPDGYEFMTDGVFGAGTLPRPCWIDLLGL